MALALVSQTAVFSDNDPVCQYINSLSPRDHKYLKMAPVQSQDRDRHLCPSSFKEIKTCHYSHILFSLFRLITQQFVYTCFKAVKKMSISSSRLRFPDCLCLTISPNTNFSLHLYKMEKKCKSLHVRSWNWNVHCLVNDLSVMKIANLLSVNSFPS